jgi:hypothetical protein
MENGREKEIEGEKEEEGMEKGDKNCKERKKRSR